MRKDWPACISRYEACFKCILAIADNSSALAGLYHHASFWAGDRLSIATSRSLFKPQPMAYLYVIVVIATVIFAVWGATNVISTEGECLTNQIWWTARYAKLAVVLAPILLALYSVSAVITQSSS